METRQSRRKREEEQAKSKLPSPPTKSKTLKSRPSHTNSSTKKYAKRRQLLQTFSKTVKNPPKFAQLISTLCSPDSGSCLTFGKYVKPTKKLFNDFNDFQYASPSMRVIGNPSVNGFVYEISYEHHGVSAHTVLKCPLRVNSDNLYYEYLVGHYFINDCYLKYPCFLETYGAYHVDKNVISEMSRKRSYSVKQLENSMTKMKTFQPNNDEELTKQLRTSCEMQFNICILNQHVSATKSMEKYIQTNSPQLINDVPQLLYQIYAPLAMLGKTFTHYDLHSENVLLYNLGKDKYIQMNYIYPDGTVSFKTNLIAKIIDYGRSYFYTDRTMNSEVIYKKVCKVCDECGKKNGYLSFNEDARPDYNVNFIPNISHDLRFMKMVENLTKKVNQYMMKRFYCISKELSQIFEHLRYDGQFGTKQRKSSSDSSEIKNVFDAAIQLKALMNNPAFQTPNDLQYRNCASIGTLNVYMDSSRKPMTFEPTTEFQKHQTDYVYQKQFSFTLPSTEIRPKDLKIGKTYLIVENNYNKKYVAVFDSVNIREENSYYFYFKFDKKRIGIQGYDKQYDEYVDNQGKKMNPYAEGVVFGDPFYDRDYHVYDYDGVKLPEKKPSPVAKLPDSIRSLSNSKDPIFHSVPSVDNK